MLKLSVSLGKNSEFKKKLKEDTYFRSPYQIRKTQAKPSFQGTS